MTFPFARVSELHRHVGQTVTVRGWVTHLRSSGKVAFVVLRDGSGAMQGVVVKNAVGPEAWETFGRLTLESRSRSPARCGPRRARRAATSSA
jgi:asparaginyl-tRNA synthetase